MDKKKIYQPSEILIGGHLFTIEYKKMTDFGAIDVDKRIISIRKNLPKETTLDTILHEAIHACLSLSGLGFLIDNDNFEEALVRAIENLVVPTFKREHLNYIASLT